MATGVVPIGGGHYLAPAPAAAWARAVAAGCPVSITSSYRSPAKQGAMRAAYLAARARGETVAYVAPVASSEHVTGYALDLRDPAIKWMRDHPSYGFVFTDPTERWHVAYRMSRDRHLIAPRPVPPGPAPAPDPTPEESELMPWFFRRNDGAIVIVTPTGCRTCTADQWATYTNLGQGVFPLGMDNMDPAPFDHVLASLGGLTNE